VIRIASAFVLLGLLLELPVLFDTTGPTAITFSFLGMPAMGAGVFCYLLSLRHSSKEDA
jgi:hypothetical protein